MTFHKDGTLPESGEFFVFGSNLAGRHGAGAARVAREKFGAVQGMGEGFMRLGGQSYAIPTKDRDLIVLPLSSIAQGVRRFLDMATNDPLARRFFVTRIGCGLAGYTDAEIAPMFKGAPGNCSFAEEWREFLS